MQHKKGLYIVSESACLVPGKGAYHHIQMGMQYLGRHFEMTLYPMCALPDPISKESLSGSDKVHPVPGYKQTLAWNTLRDLLLFFRNHRNFFSHLKKVRAARPDFIYERTAYLSFGGWLIAKSLGIPHFYENNGVQYYQRQLLYPSLLIPLIGWLERRCYQKSDFVFFVGSWGDFLELPSNNWENIENGVEDDVLLPMYDVEKNYEDQPLRLAMVAKVVPHHRMDILVEALSMITHKDQWELHFYGDGFDPYLRALPSDLRVVQHGFLPHKELASELGKAHVGVIPGSQPFPSHMKLFDYGAAKMLVVAPRVHHLKKWYGEDELEFFIPENSHDLASILDEIIAEREKIKVKGENLFRRIQRDFTWQQIFGYQASIMDKLIPDKLDSEPSNPAYRA